MTHSASSTTRRTLLASSAAGAAALALRTAAAQSGTPEASDKVVLLFVQAAGNGTLTPFDQGHTLTFQHGAAQTIYFSDRPDRLTGLVSTAEFVSQWPFADESPPNAALAISNATDSSAQVFVGVLDDPAWDAASSTLSYTFSELTDDIPAGSTIPIPGSFESATLFIDGANATTFRDKNPPLPIPGEL
ncbi:MAG: hypothetical protein R2855_08235 [Thermomicrobiales bacterium]